MGDQQAEQEQVILSQVENRVATLTLNRPNKLNAFNGELLSQAVACLAKWSSDPDVGAIVVTGAGRAFCAGGDVSAMARSKTEEASAEPSTLEQQIDSLRQWQRISWMLYEMPKITIAAVNGFAFGAGLGICLSCDLRIASDQAKFGTAYSKVGLGGDFGTTWLLTHTVGPAKAKELLFLADAIEASEALRLGLVNQVVAHETFSAKVREIAERLAHGPLTSYRYMKANVNLATYTDFRTHLDREAETHLRCGMTDDHREGARAFMEKRAPQFKGR